MSLFDRLYNITLTILVVIILCAAIGGIIAFIYLQDKKKRKIKVDNIDYSVFNRKDAKEYIYMIDDIKDDMIIVDKGTRFIAVIDCQGFDYYSAHVVERGMTVQNYIGFINTITRPISYRQFSKSVDLENTINMYMEAYEKVCSKLEALQIRQKEMQQTLKNSQDLTEAKKFLLTGEIDRTKREINALNFRKFHLEDQINHINRHSSVSIAPVITSTYVVDWVYNPMEFSVELTEEEILSKAKLELEAIVNAKIHALSSCGVKARRCKTVELIDMCRRHSQPISSERYKIRDVFNSTYFDDITTTNDIDRINEEVREALELEAISRIGFESSSTTNEKDNIFIKSGVTEGEN